jgi:hypothetical protein
METRLDVILRMAELADTLGYEVFALPEGWGFDSTISLVIRPSPLRQARPCRPGFAVWG